MGETKSTLVPHRTKVNSNLTPEKVSGIITLPDYSEPTFLCPSPKAGALVFVDNFPVDITRIQA